MIGRVRLAVYLERSWPAAVLEIPACPLVAARPTNGPIYRFARAAAWQQEIFEPVRPKHPGVTQRERCQLLGLSSYLSLEAVRSALRAAPVFRGKDWVVVRGELALLL